MSKAPWPLKAIPPRLPYYAVDEDGQDFVCIEGARSFEADAINPEKFIAERFGAGASFSDVFLEKILGITRSSVLDIEGLSPDSAEKIYAANSEVLKAQINLVKWAEILSHCPKEEKELGLAGEVKMIFECCAQNLTKKIYDFASCLDDEKATMSHATKEIFRPIGATAEHIAADSSLERAFRRKDRELLEPEPRMIPLNRKHLEFCFAQSKLCSFRWMRCSEEVASDDLVEGGVALEVAAESDPFSKSLHKMKEASKKSIAEMSVVSIIYASIAGRSLALLNESAKEIEEFESAKVAAPSTTAEVRGGGGSGAVSKAKVKRGGKVRKCQ